jgi:bacterioferritin
MTCSWVPIDGAGVVAQAYGASVRAACKCMETAKQVTEQLNAAGLQPRVRRDCAPMRNARNPGRVTVLRLLNQALATQIVCTLRSRRHYYMAFGLIEDSVRQVFLQRAGQQLAHADRIAARIVQLQGAPDFNPRGLTERSHAEYSTGDTLESMIREDLVAERIAIDSSRQMIACLGARDPATRCLMEEFLAGAEAHAATLARLLQRTQGARRLARA